MDSLTQIVLGIAVSNAVLGNKIGNKSIIYGTIFGTLPDLDVFIGKWFYDPITANEIHRGLSHSIIFFVLCSFIFAPLLSKWHQKLKFNRAFIGIFLILLTHSILDIFTTWGTQLFWPLSDKIALKSVFVIDPLYTLPLLICTIWSLRLSKDSKKRYRINNIGIILSSCYLLYGLFIQQQIINKTEKQLLVSNISYDQITAKPTAFNSILWNIIIENDKGFCLSDYSLFDRKPLNYTFYPKNEHLIQLIADEPIVKQLQHISEQEYVITQRNDSLFFNDLRFGLLSKEKEQFAFSYHLYKNENGEWQAKELPKASRDGKKLLKDLWVRMKGN